MQSHTKLRAGIIGLALTFFLVLQLLSNYPASVEKYYTNGIYPILTLIVSKITSQLPFSITEFLLWTALLIGIPHTIRRIRQKRMQLGPLILNLLSISAIIYMWFYLFWGMNYLRQPLKSKLDLENVQLEIDAFDSTFVQFIRRGNELNLEYSIQKIEQINADIDSSYNDILSQLGLRKVPGNQSTKRFVGNWLLNMTTTSGFFSPLFHEIHYNRDMLIFELPFVLAHEKAHQMGYTSEAEANFLAHLVCTNGRDPLVRYSGYFSLLGYFFLSLGNNEQRRKTFFSLVNEGVKLDMDAVRERWRSHQGLISKFSSKSYDLYLKANRVREGIQNYSRVVDLVVRYYGKNNTVAAVK